MALFICKYILSVILAYRLVTKGIRHVGGLHQVQLDVLEDHCISIDDKQQTGFFLSLICPKVWELQFPIDYSYIAVVCHMVFTMFAKLYCFTE